MIGALGGPDSGNRLGARLADLGLVAGIVAIVALMIVPMPIWLVDLLVGINISFGILLLLTTLYVREPLDFSSFPSVLLVSTLFRLALSIATTRLILLEGNAGAIIDTFGKSVAGGNLIVGLVVFLIITVVQFIVIAKGAERVAEVAARFSLDAMPGKQLSIDSDLRSGLIGKDDARTKRHKLEQESKLHGSLDGAMKFVKGDAIASIVIVIVNLLGGLAVGVWQRGMEFGDAMQRYSILTIGDGLVSQIPALLSAMAAGLLVTRASDDRHANLGDAIRQQVSANPRVLLFGGSIAMLMAIIPGFPVFVFLGLGLLAVTTGLFLHPRTAPRMARLAAPLGVAVARRRGDVAPTAFAAVPAMPTPLQPLALIYASAGNAAPTTADVRAIEKGLTDMLNRLQAQSGVPLPRLPVSVETAAEGEPQWRLLIFDAPVATGELGGDVETMCRAIEQALARHLSLLLGVQETTSLLNRVGIEYGEAVKEAVRAVPVTRIAEILRILVDEGMPISNMRSILEAIADAGQHSRDAGPISDMVRIACKRTTMQQLAPGGHLHAAVVAPALEDRLRQSMLPGENRPALDVAEARILIDQARELGTSGGARAIIVSLELRRALRALLAPDLPDLAILSYQELDGRTGLEVTGQLAIPANALPSPAAPSHAETVSA